MSLRDVLLRAKMRLQTANIDLGTVPLRAQLEDALNVLGANRTGHSNERSLMHHLSGTADIIKSWNMPAYIENAGLFHSIYSTEHFTKQLIGFERRAEIRSQIGSKAERLVYLFCRCDRANLIAMFERSTPNQKEYLLDLRDGSTEPVLAEELRALIAIILANTADQASGNDRSPGIWLAAFGRLLQCPMGKDLIPGAIERFTFPHDAGHEKAMVDLYQKGIAILLETPGQAVAFLGKALEISSVPFEVPLLMSVAYQVSGMLRESDDYKNLASIALTAWPFAWDKRLSLKDWKSILQSVDSRQKSGVVSDNKNILPGALVRLVGSTRKASEVHPATEENTTAVPEELTLSARVKVYLSQIVALKPPQHQPIFPGLATKAWHDSSAFPIVAELEARFREIRDEIDQVDADLFHRESERIDRVGSWDVLLFYELGKRNAELCALCPITSAIIDQFETVKTLAGLIYCSRMKPGTRIAAHRGPTNMRLRCHLGLHIPVGDCGIAVGGITGRWKEGKCLVFDDYLPHEAWNNTNDERIVLIVDLWNPDLDAEEIQFLKGLHGYAGTHAQNLNRYWRANANARTERRRLYD